MSKKNKLLSLMLSGVVMSTIVTVNHGKIDAEENLKVVRISGKDRFETSFKVANSLGESFESVILANGNKYPDALSGGVLASKNRPLLLTDGKKLSKDNMDILKKAKEVTVLGGANSVSKNIESSIPGKIKRISGSDRYETSVKIAETVDSNGIILANGENFPDALSGVSLAQKEKMPILLTKSDRLSDFVKNYISEKNVKNVIIVGGKNSVSDAVENSIRRSVKNVERIAGNDRYETSVKVAKRFSNPESILISSGNVFADTLSASSLLSKYNSPMILVGNNVDKNIRDYVNSVKNTAKNVFVVGGENSVSRKVVNNITGTESGNANKEELKKKVDGLKNVSKKSKSEYKKKIDQSSDDKQLEKVLDEVEKIDKSNENIENAKSLIEAKEKAVDQIDMLFGLFREDRNMYKNNIYTAKSKEIIKDEVEKAIKKDSTSVVSLVRVKENAKMIIDNIKDISVDEKNTYKNKIYLSNSRDEIEKEIENILKKYPENSDDDYGKPEKDEFKIIIKVDGKKYEINSRIEAEKLSKENFREKNIKTVEILEGTTDLAGLDFENNKISELELPNSLKCIYGNSMFGRNNIKYLKIPENIKYIRGGIFYDNKIEKLDIEEGIKEIAGYHKNGTFEGNKIKEVKLPNSIKVLGESTFKNNKIESLELPEGIIKIESGVFENNRIINLKIPERVEYIGENAFANNLLTEIKIPSNVKSIGYSAFANNKFSSLNIPDNIKEIDEYAFENNEIKELKLSDGMIDIEEGVFKNNKLTELNIPGTIEKIGSDAFYNNQLKSVYLPEGLEEIGKSAFEYNKLENIEIPGTVEIIGKNAFSVNRLKKVVIHEGVEEIDDFAFSDNKIENITIPKSVKKIGKNIFYGNSNNNADITPKKIRLPEHFRNMDLGLPEGCQVEYY